MFLKYNLYNINGTNYNYLIYHNDDILDIEIDLTQFKNYLFLNNNYSNTLWYYKIVKSKNKLKGDIEQIDISQFKKQSYPKNIIYKNNEYKLAEQWEYDKYCYLLNLNNDNSKLYSIIYQSTINYYILNKPMRYRETII